MKRPPSSRRGPFSVSRSLVETRLLLTRNHRQEALSQAYVQAIAALAGVGISTPRPDNVLRDPGLCCSRYLVVLVLPAQEELWVSQSVDALTIRHCAYGLSLQGFPATRAKRSVRLLIPKENIFSAAAIQELLANPWERR